MVLVQGQLLRSPKVIRSTSCCQAMVRSTSCWLTLTPTVPVLVGVRPRTNAPVCLRPQHQYHSLQTPWVPSTTIAHFILPLWSDNSLSNPQLRDLESLPTHPRSQHYTTQMSTAPSRCRA